MMKRSRLTTSTISQAGSAPLKPSVHEDRDEQRLVGDRIEIGAELRGCVEALGDEPVRRIRHAGDDEEHRRLDEAVGDHQPDDQRDADQPGDGDEIR